jgi:hypothetical protein
MLYAQTIACNATIHYSMLSSDRSHRMVRCTMANLSLGNCKDAEPFGCGPRPVRTCAKADDVGRLPTSPSHARDSDLHIDDSGVRQSIRNTCVVPLINLSW